MRSQIIAIANQKGGVGKTTTAINVATTLAAVRKKTLLIDLDPQGNATTGLGYKIDNHSMGIYDVLSGDAHIQQAIVESHIPQLSLIRSSMDLSASEIELVSAKKREFVLKSALSEIIGSYDYVVIDCPPALGLLTINAFVAAHKVLIPLQCEYFALEGLSSLIKTIRRIKHALNPPLDILGILLTMHDRRSALCQMIEDDVRKTLGDLVFDTVIPRNVKVSEAPSHGKPVLLYDIACSGSQAYVKVTAEILKRMKNEYENGYEKKSVR
ncbi:MAG: ParA family protein [Alphaproteobacteria bacterium]|nr:ParA family protein [Alphaproteobacteria bacterium]